MNQNTKTSNFLEAINKYAQKQKQIIEEDAERHRNEQIEQATKEGLEDAYQLIKNEISKRKSMIITEYASKENRARCELFEIRKQMLLDIKAEAVEKINTFTLTEDYDKTLLSSAKEIKSYFEGESCEVYLGPKDKDKASLIKGVVKNAEITTDSSISLGGLKAYSKSKGIILDCTFDTKLDDAMKNFTETGRLEVMLT
ncbi:MAG: V-type ATP synthase subunit E [Ruminococcus sp.]|nr:V-type ATP synthase subunit E [Ruminococcus sp.]